MTLAVKLAALREKFKTLFPAEIEQALEAHMESLRQGGLAHVINVGDKVADFSVQNQHGETVTLAALLANGPLVLSFTRGSWCPYCAEEVAAWQEAYPQLKEAGGELLILSPQNQAATRKQGKELSLDFNLGSDADNRVAKAVGVAYQFTDALRAIYTQFQLDIPTINQTQEWALPSPARLIIDQSGTVVDIKVDPDYRYRPEPADAIALIRTLA